MQTINNHESFVNSLTREQFNWLYHTNSVGLTDNLDKRMMLEYINEKLTIEEMHFLMRDDMFGAINSFFIRFPACPKWACKKRMEKVLNAAGIVK